jgi:hypothetical protein
VSGTGLYHIWLPSSATASVAAVDDWDRWMFKRTWSELRAAKRW